jgi:hypothetical protein
VYSSDTEDDSMDTQCLILKSIKFAYISLIGGKNKHLHCLSLLCLIHDVDGNIVSCMYVYIYTCTYIYIYLFMSTLFLILEGD